MIEEFVGYKLIDLFEKLNQIDNSKIIELSKNQVNDCSKEKAVLLLITLLKCCSELKLDPVTLLELCEERLKSC